MKKLYHQKALDEIDMLVVSDFHFEEVEDWGTLWPYFHDGTLEVELVIVISSSTLSLGYEVDALEKFWALKWAS